MKKTILRLLILTPLLMAFQCEEEEEYNTIFTNEYKAALTVQPNFNIDDIIWIEGKVSSKGFDASANDSIFLENTVIEHFNIMKLQINQSNDVSNYINSTGAIGDFVIVNDIGSHYFGVCEEASVVLISELSADELFFTYRIGIKATIAGDYFVSFRKSIILNIERNEDIFRPYQLTNNPMTIGFDLCGKSSVRRTNESDREFFFTVN